MFHTRLVIDFEDLREIKRIAYGKKIFETFKKDTDLPEQLYETSVVAAINILKNLQTEVNGLYEPYLNTDFDFRSFSKNQQTN